VSTPVVDSHLHVWDLEQGDYAWLGPQHGELYRSFGPEEAARELDAAGVGAAVLVQAEDSVRETRYLLDVAARFDFVTGVVGWIPLDDPPTAVEQLIEYGGNRRFCGVRHLVHDDPRDDFLELPAVRESLGVLAQIGLPVDVPDAWPRHLPAVARLAADLPDLLVVVDHLGKPPRGGDDYDAWARSLGEVARLENTVAKVSGLQTPGQPFTAEALRPVWELALEAFGVNRLMYGGDWPMTVPSGGYPATWAVLSELAGSLSPHERDWFLARTAASVYGRDVLPGAPAPDDARGTAQGTAAGTAQETDDV
jgi:L-fuconolactonase